uniref:5-formaminoimidazole-4-carboxamide-1-(beta)-D-ribofuranosyl 5'-monophosphate synthetase n=1 Tax=Ignisphaera aggregans TaxID=334771 RepID=A0A7C2ZPN8_9CREN
MNIEGVLKSYDLDMLTITTLASHSALQIVHGAKLEGFRTALVTLRSRSWFYKQFSNLIDHFIVVDSWSDLCNNSTVSKLRELNSVMIPHGSYVEYVGLECAEKIPIPLFGSRYLFAIEADQHKKMEFLTRAGIPTPRIYSLKDKIDRPVIVKLPGAKGGRGYFIARSSDEIVERLQEYLSAGIIESFDEVIIQEYLIGVTAYYHYFYSPILERVEILGADIRYESDIDGLKRLPPNIAIEIGIEPTFTVVGNIPLVLRESLLPKILEYGIRFVTTAKTYVKSGIVGPFSLESIIDRDLNIKVFEFSGRIVAGTNLYLNGSPYSHLYWNEPMSTGRRIAREIRIAIEKNAIEKVLT